jgi:hypothetical protein
MKRRLFASLLIFLAAAPCAYAQLQWFSKDGTRGTPGQIVLVREDLLAQLSAT